MSLYSTLVRQEFFHCLGDIHLVSGLNIISHFVMLGIKETYVHRRENLCNVYVMLYT